MLAGIGVGAYVGLRQVYFVGQDDRGLVTLYRGVPYELPFGIDLYDRRYVERCPGADADGAAAPPAARPPAALARATPPTSCARLERGNE